MARKGNRQKSAVSRQSTNHNKGTCGKAFSSNHAKERETASETNTVPDISNESHQAIPLSDTDADPVVFEKRSKQNCDKFPSGGKPGVVDLDTGDGDSQDCTTKTSSEKESFCAGDDAASTNSTNNTPKKAERVFSFFWTQLSRNGMLKKIEVPNGVVMILRHVEILASFASKASVEWVERQRPWFISLITSALYACDNVRAKAKYAFPIVVRWLLHFGNIMVLLSMVWFDCVIRGTESFLRLGTSAFFSVIWCGIFCIVAMISLWKFVLLLGLAALVTLFVGSTVAILLVAITGVVILWIHGSFWTTMLVLSVGGLAFTLKHEQVALFVTTLYSAYCAWTHVGWLGLLLSLNFSFMSSDALIFFLKNTIDEQRRPSSTPGQSAGMHDRPGFSGEPMQTPFAESGSGLPADRSCGTPSTSGNSDCEITSEDEVVRLLNCTDHYSALGFSRFENVDISILKREYRKKAMLVHPDKNMGNERAAEAFKKLQNAYEVLLDSFKRKSYDDELRREELLNYFRRFQNTPQTDRKHGFFGSGFASNEANSEEDPLGVSRRISCRKCSKLHLWVLTRKLKSKARWCQDCKDFHQAKDGDGWVEQSSRPLLFGIFQKVDTPVAYVCAESRIYNATEWYICQGMRCPVNTHKPSFHVNTSINSKHGSGKGSNPGQKGGDFPPPNIEETMTEEEFFEWLQSAVQAGIFENFAGGTPTTHPAQSSKGGSGSNGGSGKRKKKGKKQW